MNKDADSNLSINVNKSIASKNSLHIYNSLTRSLEKFEPLKASEVNMYVCGPTVYHFLHVGNFRGPVFFNFVRNWLIRLGYKVKFALNYTDVDDKIINRANELGISAEEVANKYIQEYQTDFKALNLVPHDFNPRITDTMDDIIKMIETLISKGNAYVSDRNVWYNVSSFKEYGKLSGRHVDELIAGVRIEVDENKKHPADFALWKNAKEGEPSWKSPWGNGRPGWHIECSAMNKKIFGEQIDIHGGGSDLIFPHHENEIAQSEGCHGKTFSKYWMHVAMLNFAGQKMSKSLGNFVTMREFLEKNHPEIYVWMVLSVHYRTSADFSEDAFYRSVSALARIYSALSIAENLTPNVDVDKIISTSYKKFSKEYTDAFKKFIMSHKTKFAKQLEDSFVKINEAINNDFSTPQMMSFLFDIVRDFNANFKRGMKINDETKSNIILFRSFFKFFGSFMSLFQLNASEFLRELDDMLLNQMKLDRQKVDELVAARTEARKQKDFKKSDEIRDQLIELKIAVMDTPQGTFWEVAK